MMPALRSLAVPALILCGSQLAHSALISSATYNLDPISVAADPDQDGVVDNPLSLTSITVDSTVYTDLTYGTATVNAPDYFYTSGDDPGSQVAALGGSIVTDGVLNVNKEASVLFSRAITSNDLIFVMELVTSGASGETLAFGLIDINGTKINGSAKLFGNTGLNDLLSFKSYRTSTGNAIGNTTLRGSAISLAELNYTGSTVPYGIYFSDSSAGELDPSVVGLATVPEPSAVSLLGLASMSLLWLRRRR